VKKEVDENDNAEPKKRGRGRLPKDQYVKKDEEN